MPFLYSIILSLIQGATEFLPISSSGHLALFQILTNYFKAPPIFFDLFLHFATLFSILFYYKKNLKNYFNFKFLSLLFFGLLGTAFIAFPLKNFAEYAFSSQVLVSFFLSVTGLILLFTNGLKERAGVLDLKKAFLMGISQGFAIIPGVSRSGITISTGIFLGVSAKNSCEFSFILSIPAILGANFLEFLKNKDIFVLIPWNSLIFPFLIAFGTGLLALKITNNIFEKKKLKFFGIYCIIISIVSFGVFFYGKAF